MNIYWIGARQWDIFEDAMFTGSVTRYGEDIHNNHSFCNNTHTTQYNEFIKYNIDNILKNDSEACFLFANELDSYNYGPHVYERSICVNQLPILESLNDKIFTRNFFSDCVDTPNSIVINVSSCSDYNFINSIFNGNFSTYVLQEAKGAGGDKTYFLSANYCPYIMTNSSHILVTPFYDRAFSINVHIIVGKNTYKIMPPSLQITMGKFKYSGSDFIAYQKLNSNIKSEVIDCAKKIAQKVQSLGGKGIFGVDFLITDSSVLFLECNYRYQGSSFLLNQGLKDNNFPSLFKCRYEAFYGDLNSIPDNVYNIPINYSSFRRTENNLYISLAKPYIIVAPNNSSFASNDKYKFYEIFNTSIIQNLVKQEVQNPY